ncbi:MAG: pyridoxal phosphate-dependent aminotransferase [Thiotrichales bacterium]|nr:pyridoxal phosphate-dependent aminotransferase [Thiotrichales bacterium]
MEIRLSSRAKNVKPSPTLAVTAKAAELRSQGRDIVSLGAGEPDFDTPEHIKQAAVDALAQGFTKYTAVDGTVELKNAIIKKFKKENKLDYTAKQILVSCGAKHSIYNLMQALLNDDDEVIIPAPYWVSYPDMARLAGAEPVIIKTGLEQRFKISKEQLRGAINDKTRLLILNSPSNPTGVSYSKEELAELAQVLLEFPEVLIATDDIYEHILWGQGKFCNIVNACPDLKDRTVVINGVSKAYSMTGWRIGFAGGPETLIGAMKKIQSQSTSNPTSIAQVAAQAALEGNQEYIKKSTKVFRERHDYVLERLTNMNGVNCEAGDGTFYIFPDLNEALRQMQDIKTDIELAELFLEQAGVALVPGSAFGAPGYMRISFATGMEQLEEAMNRLEGILNK